MKTVYINTAQEAQEINTTVPILKFHGQTTLDTKAKVG